MYSILEPRVLQFWSDASFGEDGQGAAAVYFRTEARVYKVVAYLGTISSSQAELFGGILGRVLIMTIEGDSSNALVTWFSDCESIINLARSFHLATSKSAYEEPYWRMWIHLNDLRECSPHYLSPEERGVEHKGCDRASRWIRTRGVKLIEQGRIGTIGRLAKLEPESAWHLVDARDVVGLVIAGKLDETVSLLKSDLSKLFALS